MVPGFQQPMISAANDSRISAANDPRISAANDARISVANDPRIPEEIFEILRFAAVNDLRIKSGKIGT